MTVSARLASEGFNAELEDAGFRAGVEHEGAIVTFVGIARPSSAEGSDVRGLYLDHHPRLTEPSLREIAEDAAERFGVTRLSVVHRCGEVRPGETIVWVAAAALHRRAAFEAVEYAMDRLKTDAIFWKREDAVDGSRWIEPTTIDRFDRARWSD